MCYIRRGFSSLNSQKKYFFFNIKFDPRAIKKNIFKINDVRKLKKISDDRI
jgi:hypothetical protein